MRRLSRRGDELTMIERFYLWQTNSYILVNMGDSMTNSYDVLIWNKEDLGEIPYLLANIDEEHIDVTYNEALKIYEEADKAHFRQLIQYETDDEDSSGEVILEGGMG